VGEGGEGEEEVGFWALGRYGEEGLEVREEEEGGFVEGAESPAFVCFCGGRGFWGRLGGGRWIGGRCAPAAKGDFSAKRGEGRRMEVRRVRRLV